MTPEKTILVVDDERHIVELIRLYLSKEGFRIETAYTGTEAMRKFAMVRPALILLDLMLPEIDGWEICRRVRREGNTPIIMLTARSDDIDKIVGLELGADDYLAKPFNARELVARVKAVLRRTSPDGSTETRQSRDPIVIGNTRIDLDGHDVTVAGKHVDFRSKEFDLLMAFIQNLGIVFERDKLLNVVWGYEYFGDTRTVDVHIAHLRDRLAGSTLQIQTIRGVGYKMVVEDEGEGVG